MPSVFQLWRRELSRIVIQLIASLRLGAARAPDFAVEIDQPDFARWLAARAAANADGAVDQRQFVIFLQEDHHAVRKFDALGFLRDGTRATWGS